MDPAAAKEAEASSGAPSGGPEEPPVQLNVGGWAFAVPRGKLAQFPESLLGQAAAGSAGQRLFLDRDGYAFRHVHYFLHTARLSGGSGLELPLLYEQAGLLRLAPLLQSLDNLKEGKHNLRVRPADIPIAERASLNYWRTRKCISKPCAAAAAECALKSPACSGSPEKAPLGLMDTPLLDTEDEVPYCFLPLRLVEEFPALVTDDNLLWLADAAALIECESGEFRFIANFLRSEKILLPDNFSSLDALEAEAEALGIPKVIEAVKVFRNNPGSCSSEASKSQGCQRSTAAQQQRVRDPPALLPLYPMVLGLLVKYPDSALGQLHMESTLDGNKLYISGNGVLFQHVMYVPWAVWWFLFLISDKDIWDVNANATLHYSTMVCHRDFALFKPSTGLFCPSSAGTALEEAAPCQALDTRGLILKVEHPPIVPGDGSCVFHEGSILYSMGAEELTLACALAPPVDKDVVFLSFPLTQEEIFYAQKCHSFLTDVILDSIRQKDPKETTAKVELLVRRLWRLQMTAKEFVAELLNSAPFQADGYSYEKLLKWIEFSLPFAWKYSCCINSLIKKGYFKSLSHFVIGKYLQNP
ncbi:BTB/POZ domain-containing protein KCTD19 [Pseudonaja textilis]|uniref:BTB/POZ domain-containing protein KCTD19 n=1 Tax=Pseudonaja textilis TaxID=8673 RepID=UPI000EAA5E35|nr:BTB/POZ domain-containing protein KCTD19 [Pseudonaja textilis]